MASVIWPLLDGRQSNFYFLEYPLAYGRRFVNQVMSSLLQINYFSIREFILNKFYVLLPSHRFIPRALNHCYG